MNKQSEEDKGFRACHSCSVAHGHELNEFVTEEREASNTFSHKSECVLLMWCTLNNDTAC